MSGRTAAKERMLSVLFILVIYFFLPLLTFSDNSTNAKMMPSEARSSLSTIARGRGGGFFTHVGANGIYVSMF